jgi:hypothetical protein
MLATAVSPAVASLRLSHREMLFPDAGNRRDDPYVLRLTFVQRKPLDPRIPFITAIFPIAAAATMQIRKALH